MFIISSHGGNCCGRLHIHTLPYTPASVLSESAYTFQAGFGYESSVYAKPVAPKQTAEERLKFVVDTLLPARLRQGIVEITTTSCQGQTGRWEHCLTRLGFKPAIVGINSNHGSRVTVWLMAYPKGPVEQPAPPKPKPAPTSKPKAARKPKAPDVVKIARARIKSPF